MQEQKITQSLERALFGDNKPTQKSPTENHEESQGYRNTEPTEESSRPFISEYSYKLLPKLKFGRKWTQGGPSPNHAESSVSRQRAQMQA